MFLKPQISFPTKLLSEDASPIVLVVEDDNVSYYLIQEVLTLHHVHHFRAENGLEAIDMASKYGHLLNAVLMDIRLPEMNGYDATRHIKSQHPDLPVIALTAFVHQHSARDSKAAGCDAYIAKPLDVNKLMDTLFSYISLPKH